jgi:hypothetical protein
MKALFLTTILPHRRQIGSEVASQSLIEGLRAAGVEVDILGYVRPDDKTAPALGEIAVQARYIESSSAKLYPLLWLLQSLVNRLPYSAAKYRSNVYASWVEKLMAQRRYDFVVIDHPQMGWAARTLVHTGLPLVFVAHNIEHEMYRQLATAHGRRVMRVMFAREAKLIKRMEDWLARAAAEVWTLTVRDAAHFKRVAPAAKVREMAIAGSSSARSASSTVKQCDVALIGSWAWAANREALGWFLDQVCPHLPADVSVQIAGKGGEYVRGRYPNVEYIGFVPDAIAFLQSARVVAIPTLSGGGIQIKTLDAIASCSRIVATPCAVRGIANPPHTVTVVEDPRLFAAELVDAAGADGSEQQTNSALEWSVERDRRFREQIRFACQTFSPLQPHPAAGFSSMAQMPQARPRRL